MASPYGNTRAKQGYSSPWTGQDTPQALPFPSKICRPSRFPADESPATARCRQESRLRKAPSQSGASPVRGTTPRRPKLALRRHAQSRPQKKPLVASTKGHERQALAAIDLADDPLASSERTAFDREHSLVDAALARP